MARHKDREMRKKMRGLNRRKTNTVSEGNPRGVDISMKNLKQFLEEKAGSRRADGGRSSYSAGLGRSSTRAYQDGFRQPKMDVPTSVANPADSGKQVEEKISLLLLKTKVYPKIENFVVFEIQ